MAVTAGIAFTDAVNTNNNRQVIIKALRDNSVSIEQYHNRLSSHLSDVPKHLAENTIDYPAGIKALIEKTEILFIIRQDTFISISSALRNIEFYIDRINIVPDDEKEAAFRRILANYRTLTRLLNDEIAYIDQNNRPWNRWLQP
jgi:deoxyxylulose-5-phosphate synthase